MTSEEREEIVATIEGWWDSNGWKDMNCCGCSTYSLIVDACIRAIRGQEIPNLDGDYFNWDDRVRELDERS
jgi:hypothetical protein